MMVHYSMRVLALLAGLLLLGCSSTAQDGVAGTEAGQSLTSGQTGGARADKLANGEKLRVVVVGEPQLSGDFAVDPAGQISYPMLGQIQAADLTPRELEQSLSQKLKGRYLVNPQVFVEVVSHRPFYIIGEIKSAGEYPYKTGLNIVTAVALAGGYTPRASSSYVYIKRANEGQEKEFPASPNVPVRPGDLIRVPERYF